jgi:hypothetical protein
MFEWNDDSLYEWARMITHQQVDSSTTFAFRFPSGSNCYDENSISRLFPELMSDLMDAYLPSIDMSVVYNASFGVTSDGQLGSSAPGNDPRFDAAFRWIKVGKQGGGAAQGGIPRHKKNQSTLRKEKWLSNRYESLPIDEDSKGEVIRSGKASGTTLESADLHSANMKPKWKGDQKQRAAEVKASDDEILDQAMQQAALERERYGLGSNEGPPQDSLGDKKMQYAQVAKDNVERNPTFSVEGQHQEKMKHAARASEIAQISKQVSKGVDRELDLPQKYKTDNDETKALQDELLRRKGNNRALN